MRRATLLAGLLCGACQSAPAPVQLSARASAPAPDRYEEIVEAHTRRAHIYDLLEDKVHARALYHSPAFKQAFFAARERFQGRAAEHVEHVLRGTRPPKDPMEQLSEVVRPFAESMPAELDTSQAETFLLALYVAEQEHRSIDHDSSIWDVTLSVDGGAPVKPIKIERLRRTPSLDQVYPFLAKLDIPYLLFFPPQDAAGQPLISARSQRFTLRVVSKLADAQMSWERAR